MSRATVTDELDCPKCGAHSSPEESDLRWDSRRNGEWLRGVRFMRADPVLGLSEFICCECGCTFSRAGLPIDWERLELLAGRPVALEMEQAREQRLEPDEDSDAINAMVGEVLDRPDDLIEPTPLVPTVAEGMAAVIAEYPEIVERALSWQTQLKQLIEARPDLVKS